MNTTIRPEPSAIASALGASGHSADVVPALALDGVSKSFGKVKAVDRVSLSIYPGEIVAFLGPNGAGKTTTLDIALGLSRPTSGSVAVYGGTPRAAIDRGWMSALLQTGGILTEYRVRELVSMIAGFLPASRPVEQVLERANLTDIQERRISKCSGGEQQRLRFALAILADPTLLVLDEPTAGMDVTARRHFWQAMDEEAQNGKTIIFATHYLTEAESFAQRTIIMNEGQVVADAPTGEIRRHFGVQRITAGFDTPDHLDAAARRLAQQGPVSRTADTLTVSGADTVALARLVLDNPGVVSISITDRSLEDAFEQLTEGDANDGH
ncbi:MAG: ABC transporter ATP-binding protein [Actinomycetaceae bacterium]|nr:ABC transporter ATP-binding protein [Actinomycetaceae bacterium]